MTDRYEALRKKLEQAGDYFSFQHPAPGTKEIKDLLADRDSLAAQVEALKVDAERYRWLEGQAVIVHYEGGNSGLWNIYGIPGYSTWVGHAYNHETFKAAIDAARKEQS